MNFYLYPENLIEFETMLDILLSEGVCYRIKTEKLSIGFGYAETKYFIVNCEFEKFEFIKYLVNKKVEQINKLEKCITVEANDNRNIAQKLIIPPRPYFSLTEGVQFAQMQEEIKEKLDIALKGHLKKEQKSSKLYSMWKKLFNK